MVVFKAYPNKTKGYRNEKKLPMYLGKTWRKRENRDFTWWNTHDTDTHTCDMVTQTNFLAYPMDKHKTERMIQMKMSLIHFKYRNTKMGERMW